MSISTNVVSVIFGNSRRACGDRILHQRDRGQILTFSDLADQLPSTFQVWFANHPEIGTAVPQTGSGGNVAIPDTLVATGQPIWAWLYLHTGADDGETCYTVTILNTAQPAFTGATPTPTQASAWDEAIDAMNAAIEAAEVAANHGPQIVNGFWYTWDAAAGEYVNTNVQAEGEDGEPGAPGNSIWWTVSLINDESMAGQVYGKIRSSWLKGRSGSPAVHDLVVGPAVGTSGSIEWLYEITAVSGIYCNLHGIGSIKGAPGDPGEDGFAPVVTIETITDGHRVTITSAAHPEGQSFDVMNGERGPAGPSGGQFWTAKSASTSPDYTWAFSNLIGPDDETPAVGDVIFYSIYRYTVASVDLQNQKVTCTARTSLRGPQGQPGPGVPANGDLAQVLSKKSATDYDTQWAYIIDLLPSTFKAALLQLAQKVVYIDDQGADYYQDLYDALYPPKELVSISAVFTQGQTVVYDTASLDSLKTMLVVTGTYDDQSTETIPSTGYTLSGTLTAGTSTITVTCDGKTTTFTVQVTHQPGVYAVTNNLTGCVNSNSANSVTEGDSYSGTISASAGYMMTGATVSITMGGTDITSTAYNNGTISIASVTGALVITVTAVAVTLSSISAVYTQSGTVYTTDTLDSLKTDLVVMATYSDSSTATVAAADYTLSGTLSAGTSTITVSYGGKTTTFTVTVTDGSVLPAGYEEVDSICNPIGRASGPYLDTGLTLSGTGDVVVDISFMSYGGETTPYVMGCLSSDSANTIGLGISIQSDYSTIIVFPGTVTSIAPSVVRGVKHNITATVTSTGATITDGTLTDSKTFTPRAHNVAPLYLFGIKKYNSTDVNYPFTGRIYSCVVTEGGVKKLDLVPCVRTSDGMAGFYDLVAETFIGNSTLVAVPKNTPNTVAQIASYDKIFVHSSTEPAFREESKTNGGTTPVYDMDAATTTLFPAGIIPTAYYVIDNGGASIFVYDGNGDPVNFVTEAGRWGQNVNGTLAEFSKSWNIDGGYSKISFSLDTRYLDSAYMYDKTTGKIWFAGAATPYYGMSNISEATS